MVEKKKVIRKPKAVAPKKKAPAIKDTEEHKHPEAGMEQAVKPKVHHGKNYYAVGKRKTAVAQALISAGDGTIVINSLPFASYFQSSDLQHIVLTPLKTLGVEKTINVKGKIHGGGIHAQAESLRHAISRGLILLNPESRTVLKKQGFLTRDPRVKERKKPGLKRARRAPQFSKR